MLLEELRSEFILDCRIRNLSERTIETYELNISLFLRWLEKEMKVNELSPLNKNHFKMYVVHLQREQYQTSYINLLMKCLKSFFNYLVEEEYVSINYPKQIKVLKGEQKVMCMEIEVCHPRTKGDIFKDSNNPNQLKKSNRNVLRRMI